MSTSNRWERVRLEDLIDVHHGFPFEGKYFVDEPGDYLLVTPGNFAVGGGFQLREGRETYYRGPVDSDYVLASGGLIVTMTDLSKASDTLEPIS